MSDNSAYESRVRRAANRLGWRVEKSRARNLHSNNHGMYQLINDYNTVVGGVDYDATLDVIDYFVHEEARRRAA